MVWAIFQFAAVNIMLAAETVPSAVLLLATGMVTSASGRLFKITLNVAMPPASDVVSPATGDTVTPATSSSALLAETSLGSLPL